LGEDVIGHRKAGGGYPGGTCAGRIIYRAGEVFWCHYHDHWSLVRS